MQIYNTSLFQHGTYTVRKKNSGKKVPVLVWVALVAAEETVRGKKSPGKKSSWKNVPGKMILGKKKGMAGKFTERR